MKCSEQLKLHFETHKAPSQETLEV